MDFYERKIFEELWKLLNFSDDNILGINWNEKYVKKIENHLSNLGFNTDTKEAKSVFIKFNNNFFREHKFDGMIFYFLIFL